MLKLRTVYVTLLFVIFTTTGCAPSLHRNRTRAGDWQSGETVQKAEPTPPAPAVTASNLPVAPSIVSTVAITETWMPLMRWCEASGLAAPSLLSVTPVPTYALHTSYGDFSFRAGSHVAHWNGTELRLGFAPLWIDRQPYLHGLDLKKTLWPLLTEGPHLGSNSFPVIVLDPGHGGEDSGARSVIELSWEKQFTLDWARRLQSLLITNGWQVFLTRTGDHEMTLSNRVSFAAEHHADVFLSLHFNSAGTNQTQAGLETYCLTPTGMPSTITRGYVDDTEVEFPNNAFDAQNLQLALRLHRTLLEVNGISDRGVRRARFLGVLRGQQRPAILIEGGYLSNPREARLIAQAEYRQKLAQAIALALATNWLKN